MKVDGGNTTDSQTHPGQHDITDLLNHRRFSLLLHGLAKTCCKNMTRKDE